jgi:aconitate hydratase
VIDDSMIITPPEKGDSIEVMKGPNIQPCPYGKPLQKNITAEVVIKTGDNVTTDHIIPAGSEILPLRSNIPEIAKHVFEVLDPDFYTRAVKAESGIIVGGENYGQGSSREHAALAPMFLGIKIVIAKGFARIHMTNLVNFGILPLTFVHPGDYDMLEIGDIISFKQNLVKTLKSGGSIQAMVTNKGKNISLNHNLTGRFINIIIAGGLLPYTVT